MDDDWIDTAETRALLGASWSKVQRLVDAGTLIEYRRPSSPRYPVFRRSEVEALCVPVPRHLSPAVLAAVSGIPPAGG